MALSATESAPEQPPHAAPRRRRRLRLLLRIAAAVLLLAGGAETGRVLLGRNLHTIGPGQVYRCAQPSPECLAHAVERLGIRTVINLRGCCNPFDWYLAESRATQALSICQEDVCLSAGRLPSVPEV